MKKNAVVPSVPEAMGLRVQATQTLRPFDALLVVALLLSGGAWLWLSMARPERDLVQFLNLPGGRALAAALGVASVLAVIRSLFVARWPLSDDDGSLL